MLGAKTVATIECCITLKPTILVILKLHLFIFIYDAFLLVCAFISMMLLYDI